MQTDRKMSRDLKGILLVDKPSGCTSHDVVDKMRRAAGIRKIGHTGTLDPAATGLLILCLGAATRLSEHLTGLDKTYEGKMRLGVVTDSYDMDGEILGENEVPPLTEADIQAVFDEFAGDILQAPPMVSAVKVGGERLYKKARKGETVERERRPVTVHEFALLGYEAPLAHFRARCTSGTYVRSLCHEVGERLGCGGTLDSLRRTAVGKHNIEDALPIGDFQSPDDILARIVPLGEALDLPEVVVRSRARRLIASGSPLKGGDIRGECPATDGWLQLKSEDGELLALATVQRYPEPMLNPKRVFVGLP